MKEQFMKENKIGSIRAKMAEGERGVPQIFNCISKSFGVSVQPSQLAINSRLRRERLPSPRNTSPHVAKRSSLMRGRGQGGGEGGGSAWAGTQISFPISSPFISRRCCGGARSATLRRRVDLFLPCKQALPPPFPPGGPRRPILLGISLACPKMAQSSEQAASTSNLCSRLAFSGAQPSFLRRRKQRGKTTLHSFISSEEGGGGERGGRGGGAVRRNETSVKVTFGVPIRRAVKGFSR